jgi:protocatechuate 3,4-dioxygenase alpha subunit
MGRGQTPSQTVGPFFKNALVRREFATVVNDRTRGERVIIEGAVLDGDRAPVGDAMLEIWQANSEGRYDHPADTQEKLLDPNFYGFGRIGTAQDGSFRIVTIKPGPVPGAGGRLQAPHISVSVFARGLLKRLATRIYFPGEALNQSDPVLNEVPAERRPSLIARPGADGALRFDIILQGTDETVFFDI